MKIIITSPSLNPQNNISGIASLTTLMISLNKDVNYQIFELGKRDKGKRSILWVFKQLIIPIRFFLFLRKTKPDFVHLNVPFSKLAIVRDLVLSIIAYICKKPIIVHIRGGKYLTEPCNNFLLRHFIRLILKTAKKIIVLGYKEKQKISQDFFIPKDKIIILPNAVKVASYTTLKEKRRDGRLYLLFLGRLDKDKGFPELEDALFSLKEKGVDFLLSVCGEGPYKDIFLKKIKGRVDDQVVFHGIVEGNDKISILKNTHIFLLPSYFEGLPNALLEAMGNFCVPIVTPVGSIPEVINDGQNGIIVPVHNSVKIADAIINLNQNREFLKILSINAHSTVQQKFNIDNYFNKLNSIYTDIQNKQ